MDGHFVCHKGQQVLYRKMKGNIFNNNEHDTMP